jgi:GT2 family glycosyltransferase
MQLPKVDIVIPVHNAFAFLERCVHSIFCADTDLIGKIIISDDHSDEGDVQEVLKKYHKKNKIIFTKPPKRSYFSGNVNHGFQFVTEKYFLMLSTDTRVISYDWLKTIINEYESRDDLGIVSPCLPEYLNPQPVPRHSDDLNFIGAVAWCIRSDLFKDMNFLREDGNYAHWNSDAEFCARIIKRNLKIAQVPTYVSHWGGRSKQFVPEEIWQGRHSI